MKDVSAEDIKTFIGYWADVGFLLGMWWSVCFMIMFQLIYFICYEKVFENQKKLEVWFMGPEPKRRSEASRAAIPTVETSPQPTPILTRPPRVTAPNNML